MGTNTLPGPPRVQIQTQAGCNGRCVFCPNEEVLKSDLAHGKMPPELFEKIIDDLTLTPPRRILLYLQNEPLNDKRNARFCTLHQRTSAQNNHPRYHQRHQTHRRNGGDSSTPALSASR